MEYNEDLLMGYSSYGEIEIEKMWKGISIIKDPNPVKTLKKTMKKRYIEVADRCDDIITSKEIAKETAKENAKRIENETAERIAKETENRIAKEPAEENAKIITKIKEKKYAIKRDYKKDFHKIFVNECLRPYDYLKGHGDVFAFFQVSDCGYEKREDSDSTQYHISLMTPAMACTDYIYHNPPENKPWWYEHYRPYYYYLTLDIPNDDNVWNTFYADHKTGMWVEAQIYEPGEEAGEGICRKGLLSFGGSDSYTREISVRFIAQKEEDDKTDKEIGEAIKKAKNKEEKEKIKNIKKQMIDELLQSYNKCLEETETTELSDFLNKTIPKNVREYKVKVLNVGEANCIHIEAANKSFLFDVGIPKDYENPDYYINGIGSSIGLIKKYKPDFVMISHLHYDHLVGFIHMSDQGINCHWIMPMPERGLKDFTVVRIILYVLKKQKLTLVRGGYGRRLYANKNYCDFEVFRGKKTLKKNDEIDLNSGSLMLRIRNALFSGDCMYKDWPKALKRKRLLNKIDWLVAPHHGSYPNVTSSARASDKANAEANAKVMEMLKGKKRSAIVCVGHNDYDHPRDAHFENLINNGVDSIYVTGGKTDIQYKGKSVEKCQEFISVHESVSFRAEYSVQEYLNLILRHRPEMIGIQPDKKGWMNVKELIDGISETYEFDMNALEEIVNNDDIQRYVLNEDKSMIKAKWGHSFKVEPDEDKPSEESLRW